LTVAFSMGEPTATVPDMDTAASTGVTGAAGVAVSLEPPPQAAKYSSGMDSSVPPPSGAAAAAQAGM